MFTASYVREPDWFGIRLRPAVASPAVGEPFPDDHDCEECGCFTPRNERGPHFDEYGFCLGCGGCNDPECCGHDDSCYFGPEPS